MDDLNGYVIKNDSVPVEISSSISRNRNKTQVR